MCVRRYNSLFFLIVVCTWINVVVYLTINDGLAIWTWLESYHLRSCFECDRISDHLEQFNFQILFVITVIIIIIIIISSSSSSSNIIISISRPYNVPYLCGAWTMWHKHQDFTYTILQTARDSVPEALYNTSAHKGIFNPVNLSCNLYGTSPVIWKYIRQIFTDFDAMSDMYLYTGTATSAVQVRVYFILLSLSPK
jgi:hypothetical protein